MQASQWVCHKCGQAGGFILLGYGNIECPSCKTRYIVQANGRLVRIFAEQPYESCFGHFQVPGEV